MRYGATLSLNNGQSAANRLKEKYMKKLTLADFENRIKERFPTESFTVLEFNGMKVPAKIKCDTCGEIIEVNHGGNFLAKNKVYGCKNCNGLWKQREEKLNKIKEYYDIIKTEIKETHTYYTIKCKNCGHERTSTLNNLYKHLDCGCKTKVYRNRNAEEFIQEVNRFNNNEYTLISDYKDQLTKVLLRHSCGFIWEVRPSDVIHGRSYCPKCGHKESAGERFIRGILEKLNIPFEQEKRLNNSQQRFDFYLPNDGNPIAIEFNGEQHYRETDFFKGTLEVFQERDERKKKYCEENNITLITIPYWYSKEDIIKVINSISSTT